jgi:transposase
VDALTERYQAGASVRELTETFGVHRTTILKHLTQRGVPRRQSTRKLTNDQAAEAKALHHSGISYAEIARQFQVSVRTIRREVQGVTRV